MLLFADITIFLIMSMLSNPVEQELRNNCSLPLSSKYESLFDTNNLDCKGPLNLSLFFYPQPPLFLSFSFSLSKTFEICLYVYWPCCCYLNNQFASRMFISLTITERNPSSLRGLTHKLIESAAWWFSSLKMN